MALSVSAQETLAKLNVALEKAQRWLAENYPRYEQAFSQVTKQEEARGSDFYYGLMGILMRTEYEGEEIFKAQLREEYILTEAVREKVRAIIDCSGDADERIEAWRELKELVDIK